MAYFILLILIFLLKDMTSQASNEATWCDELYIKDHLSPFKLAEKLSEQSDLITEYCTKRLTTLLLNLNQDKIKSIVDPLIQPIMEGDIDFSLFISSHWFKYYVQADDELRRKTILSN